MNQESKNKFPEKLNCENYQAYEWGNCRNCGAPEELHKTNPKIKEENLRFPYKD